MVAEVDPEELLSGDIVIEARIVSECCGHPQVKVKVSRSPYAEAE